MAFEAIAGCIVLFGFAITATLGLIDKYFVLAESHSLHGHETTAAGTVSLAFAQINMTP